MKRAGQPVRGKILPLDQPRGQPVVFAHRVDTRGETIHIFGPVGQFDLAIRVAVHVDIMATDQVVDEINCRKLRCAKVQPIFPPRKLVERHIIKPPPTETAKATVATRCPPTDVSMFQHDNRIPRLCQAQRRRKARKPTTHDCNIARNVTVQG